MRTMRWNSRRTIVLKPTTSVRARLTSPGPAPVDVSICVPVSVGACWPALMFVGSLALMFACSRRSDLARRRGLLRRVLLDEPHEQLLETVALVAHRQHLDAGAAQAREDVVQVLFLGDLDLERVI